MNSLTLKKQEVSVCFTSIFVVEFLVYFQPEQNIFIQRKAHWTLLKITENRIMYRCITNGDDDYEQNFPFFSKKVVVWMGRILLIKIVI